MYFPTPRFDHLPGVKTVKSTYFFQILVGYHRENFIKFILIWSLTRGKNGEKYLFFTNVRRLQGAIFLQIDPPWGVCQRKVVNAHFSKCETVQTSIAGQQSWLKDEFHFIHGRTLL